MGKPSLNHFHLSFMQTLATIQLMALYAYTSAWKKCPLKNKVKKINREKWGNWKSLTHTF
jgi:hypothetical protein